MANHVLLETITLTQTASSITFDNLPTTGYSDLKIVTSSRINDTTPNIEISFNGVTTTFTNKVVYGSGTAPSSTSYPRHAGYAGMSSDTSNVYGNTEIYIPEYLSSNYKSFYSTGVSENNGSQAYIALDSGLWSNGASITSVTLTPQSGSFIANSTFSIYGIAKFGITPLLSPKATGGNIVANDGTYWYHAFLSSGLFTPQIPLVADVLTIAGGGSGAENNAGGGAGGVLYSTSQSLTVNPITVVVGAGGNGRATATGLLGQNGGNSSFGLLTAKGGGGGQSDLLGGSGGGAGVDYSPYTVGQGNTGGLSGPASNNYTGGGGGGAGAAGSTGSATVAGKGGDGTNAYSAWATATSTGVSGYYAGGGGGGWYTSNGDGSSAGAGAGGGGTAGRPGTNATANTGSGGGGGTRWAGGTNYVSTNGGSGIVIVRYPIA